MTVAGINIDEAIKNMQSQLAADKTVSPALKTSMRSKTEHHGLARG